MASSSKAEDEYLVGLFGQESHLGCRLSKEDMADALTVSEEKIQGLSTSILKSYQENGGTKSFLTQQEKVSWLSIEGNLEKVLGKLGRPSLEKVQSVFNEVVFNKSNPIQIFAEAQAIIQSLKPSELKDFKAMMQIEDSIDLENLPQSIYKALMNPEKRIKYERYYQTLSQSIKEKLSLVRTERVLNPGKNLRIVQQRVLVSNEVDSPGIKFRAKEAIGLNQIFIRELTTTVVMWFMNNPEKLPPGFPKDNFLSLEEKLTNKDLWEPNQRPRIEIRAVSESICQVAIAFTDTATRNEATPILTEAFRGRCEISKAGTTTLEFGEIGVNKACPMNVLSYPFITTKLLKEMRYTPGPVIDAFKQGIIVSDADGTIWDVPKSGVDPKVLHLGNSGAKESIFRYLRGGGVLIINSGNEIQRTVDRILLGLTDVIQDDRNLILSRIAVCGMGGHVFRIFNENGEHVSFSAYAKYCQIPKSDKIYETSMGYLGDDPKLDGNDMPGFFQRDLDRCLCVPLLGTELPEKGVPSERVYFGGVEAVSKFFEAVCTLANKSKGARLFDDFGAIISKMG